MWKLWRAPGDKCLSIITENETGFKHKVRIFGVFGPKMFWLKKVIHFWKTNDGFSEYLPIYIEMFQSEILWGKTINTKDDMESAAKAISKNYGTAVLCKGGHHVHDADDLLCAAGKITWFNGQRIDNPNTHGTGCTLSSAIAANLAKGFSLEESIARAKNYISDALAPMLDLGQGAGPLHHLFDLQGRYAEEA